MRNDTLNSYRFVNVVNSASQLVDSVPAVELIEHEVLEKMCTSEDKMTIVIIPPEPKKNILTEYERDIEL